MTTPGAPASQKTGRSAEASPALPAFWEMHAPAHWNVIDFISDLHLAPDAPKGLAAFAAHLRYTEADAVFILGDLFEVWVGDDSRHEGFEAECAELLGAATAHRSLAFMPGNRDFLVGNELLQACGVLALADPTVLIAFGERILLSHGDALCLDDLPYQRFRSVVRSNSWREEFLARPLPTRRRLAREIRQESERRKAEERAGRYIDIDCAAAVRWMHESAAPTLIHGHTHSPGSEEMAPGFTRHVLTDWDLDHAKPDKARAEVLRLRRSGLRRMAPTLTPILPITPITPVTPVTPVSSNPP